MSACLKDLQQRIVLGKKKTTRFWVVQLESAVCAPSPLVLLFPGPFDLCVVPPGLSGGVCAGTRLDLVGLELLTRLSPLGCRLSAGATRTMRGPWTWRAPGTMTPLGTMNWTMSTRAPARDVSSCEVPGQGSLGSLAMAFGGTGEGLAMGCGWGLLLSVSRAALLPSPRRKQRELSQRLRSSDSISRFSLWSYWAAQCHVIGLSLSPERGFGHHMGICSPWFLLSLEPVHALAFFRGEARWVSALGNAGPAAASPFALLPLFQISSRSRGSRQQ